jgi:hypothetical protein
MNAIGPDRSIFATFILRGKGLKPSEVTMYLGLVPSKSFSRGDWRTKTEKWHHNFWSLTSQDKVHSDNLSDHIEWLIGQLKPVLHRLQEVFLDETITAEISCFWIMSSNHEGFGLKPELTRIIADLGIELAFDIYGPDLDNDSA